MCVIINCGILYLVATPIGNLGDISERALKTLEDVDFIVAEDTRVSMKILNKFEIKKELVSFHEHSNPQIAEKIIERVASGESCAVVTDAGMPCISDPGELIVKKCYEHGIKVTVIPGACAVVTALAISGQNTSRFAFEGFLSVNKKTRREHLEKIKDYDGTLIFYEAPHKLKTTLQDLLLFLGNRQISLCREITKIYEEVLRFTIQDALNHYLDISPKGEYVLVVEGATTSKEVQQEPNTKEAVQKAQQLVQAGVKTSEACKEAAKLFNVKKSEIYSALVDLED